MIKSFLHHAHLYRLFLVQYLKRMMEYRGDFLIGLGGFLLFQASGIAFLYLVFKQIPQLNGWGFNELLFIYGFAQIPRGLDHLFCDNLWMLSGRIIINGEFDKYLLRPINPLFHLISEIFQPDALGELAVGFALVIYASTQLSLTWTLEGLAAVAFLSLMGMVIYTALKLIFASLSFWLKFSQSIVFFMYTFGDFAKYPLEMFHPFVRGIITFAFPFAFTAVIPASWFVGRGDTLWVFLGTTLAAAGTWLLGITVWKAGIRAYESSGS